MEDNIRLQQMINGLEGAYQNQLTLQQMQEQGKEQLKQVEEGGGVLGLFEAKKALLKKFKDKVSEKVEEGVNKVKQKIQDKVDEVGEKVQSKIDEIGQKAQDAFEQPQQALKEVAQKAFPEQEGDIEMSNLAAGEQAEAPVVENLSHIQEGDSMADIVRDGDKFNEFVKEVKSPDTEELFKSAGKDITNDEHIEEVRGTLKNIVDNPQGGRQEAIAEELNNKVPFPKSGEAPAQVAQEAEQEATQQFISPEITGALRGDTTIARALSGAKEAVTSGAKEVAETGAKEAVATGAKEVAETGAKQVAEAGGKEAIAEGAETGLASAGEAVSAIPGLDLLAPIFFIGTALASIFGHKKTPDAPVIHNFSSQFGA